MPQKKTILITGSTDGIGYEAAKTLIEQGHRVLLHGRNPEKLAAKIQALQPLSPDADLQGYICDLSSMADVETLATSIAADHGRLDVLLNNAGILKTASPITAQGHDVRFLVNTFAPYGPLVVSVNPASLIGTKMVKDGFGIAGKDIRIGADILVEAAIGKSFEGRTGEYFDNDAGRFGAPHPHAEDDAMILRVVDAIEKVLVGLD